VVVVVVVMVMVGVLPVLLDVLLLMAGIIHEQWHDNYHTIQVKTFQPLTLLPSTQQPLCPPALSISPHPPLSTPFLSDFCNAVGCSQRPRGGGG